MSIKQTKFWRDLDPELKKQLERPLQNGENPALNVPLLHEAFGTSNPDELICEMAGGILQIRAFMKETRNIPKRNRRGHPTMSTLLLDEVGIPTGMIPDWANLELKKRFLAGMRTAKESTTKLIGAKHWARKILKQKTLLGWPNHCFLDGSVTEDTVDEYAKSFADAFNHPGRLQKEQTAILKKMELDHLTGDAMSRSCLIYSLSILTLTPQVRPVQ